MRKPRHLYHDSDNVKWNDYNSEEQRRFMLSWSPFLGMSGGYGSGKTWVLVRRALSLLIDTPYFGDLSGNIGLIGRYHMADFEKTTLVELKKAIPRTWIRKYWKKDGIFEFWNESLLHFTHYDEKEHLQSYNLGFAAIDQMEQIDEDVFNALSMERIRLMDLSRPVNTPFKMMPNKDGIDVRLYKDEDGNPIVDKEGYPVIKWRDSNLKLLKDKKNRVLKPPDLLDYQCIFGVCNPRRGWIYDKFVKNEFYRKSKSQLAQSMYNPDFEIIELPTTKNIANLPANYIERQKRSKSARDFRRSVVGGWDAFEGQVYEDFNDNLILPKNLIPYPWLEIYAGLDHGGSGTVGTNRATNITAVIFFALESREGNYPKIHVFDEIDLESSTVEYTVECIHDKLKVIKLQQDLNYPDFIKYDKIDDIVKMIAWRCDPNMQKHMDDSTETFIEAYMRHAAMRGYDLPLAPGGSGVQERIQRINWMFRMGYIDVNPKCIRFIENARNYELGKNEKPKSQQDDHHINAFEYAVTAVSLWDLNFSFDNKPKTFVDKVMEQHRKSEQNAEYDPIFGERYAVGNYS